MSSPTPDKPPAPAAPDTAWEPTQRHVPTPRTGPAERFAPTERVTPNDRFTPTERYQPTEHYAPTQRLAPGETAPIDVPFEPTQHINRSPQHISTERYAPTQRLGDAPAQASPGNALPLGTRLGEFELTRVLGEGGFGVVYLAQDHSLRREVAIKEYMPAALATRADGLQVQFTSERNRAVFGAGLISFINEARLLAKFDHPSLVKVYRFWQANGTAYMVMPFYEGATLKDTLAQIGGPPDERWLMAFLGAITEALRVIHADHFLHRDIAPDNILLLSGDGRPLLLDFGAARQVIGDATQALTAILKPGFAPVEQYAEAPGLKQGPWTDIYALCAVVYTAIMGRKPPVSVGRTVRDSYLPLARNAAGRYSAQFLEAIDAGLALQPSERTSSVAALRLSLGLDGPQQTASAMPGLAAMPPPLQAVPLVPILPLAQPPVAPVAAAPAAPLAAEPMPAIAAAATKPAPAARGWTSMLGWIALAAAVGVAAGAAVLWFGQR